MEACEPVVSVIALPQQFQFCNNCTFARKSRHTTSDQFNVIALTINGENRSFPAPLNAAGLIEHLNLQGKRVALERNGEIVPRGQFEAQELSDGDTLEIVIAVGGG
jgi:sulfur carrier protein